MKSLKDTKTIEKIFSDGKKIYTPTINAKFILGSPEIMISVPIRLFKKAVDRNRLKRLIRESVRNKFNDKFSIALIYNSSKIESFDVIEKDVNKIFNNLKLSE
jgi:ribonuclease P protein component